MQFEKYTIDERQTSVSIENSETASLRRKNIKKTGIRAFDGKKMGISGFLGNDGEAIAKKKAVENLKRGVDYRFELEQDISRNEIDIKRKISDDELLKIADNTTNWISCEFDDFRFSGRFFTTMNKTMLENTSDLSLSHEIGYFSMYYTFKKKSSTSIFDGFLSYSGRDFEIESFKRYSSDLLKAYDNKAKSPSSRMPVIFAEEAVLGKLFNELNPHLIESGSSLLSGKIDKKIFSEKFNLINGRIAGVDLEPFFDSEGVVPDNGIFEIIKDGVIISPYTDKKISEKYGFKKTANASSAYDGMHSPSPQGLRMETTGNDLIDVINDEKCILVVMASGGDYTSSGDYNTPVQLSFLVESGKITARLPELYLSSNIFSMYGEDFIGVASDPFRKGNLERVFGAYMKISSQETDV